MKVEIRPEDFEEEEELMFSVEMEQLGTPQRNGNLSKMADKLDVTMKFIFEYLQSQAAK